MSGDRTSRVGEAMERGDLRTAAQLEAAACDRDGYWRTADLIRALAAKAGIPVEDDE